MFIEQCFKKELLLHNRTLSGMTMQAWASKLVKNLSFCSNRSHIVFGDTSYLDWLGYIIGVSVFYLILSTLCIINNCMIIWIVAKNRKLRTNINNYFICNIALADLISGVFVAPFQVKNNF
jgi:hypothetical protein